MTTFEMATPQLVDLQAAVEAVHARWFGGDAAEAGAVLVTGTGPAANPGPIGMQILEAACSGHHAERFGQWWAGDYSAWDGDPSDGDWFGANEAAYQLIRLGLDGPNAAADLEQLLRAGPWRKKWDSPRPGTDDAGNPIRTTILGLLIGKALKRQRGRSASIPRIQFRQAGPDATDEEAPPAPAAPIIETSEDKVARLERELAEERRAHARTRAEKAVQATIIREHNRVEAGLRAEVEWLNRQIYADYRLTKVNALPDSQKDTMKAIARVATKRSDHFDTDTPIITGEQLAEEIGKCEKTARTAAEAVCSLPGSPVKRVSDYRTDGTYGQITTYELAIRDPVEILEQFVVIAESLEKKKPTRAGPPACQKHPKARLNTLHECTSCQEIVELQPLCGKIVRIAPEPSTPVDVVVTPAQNVRVAATPEMPETADERAAAMVATDTGRGVDQWKRPETKIPIDFEAIREARQRDQEPPLWLGDWPDTWPDDQLPDPPRCIRAGCSEPCGPGDRLLCSEHRAEANTPTAVAGGSE
jgi:hypothetical protein